MGIFFWTPAIFKNTDDVHNNEMKTTGEFGASTSLLPLKLTKRTKRLNYNNLKST